MKDLAPDIPRQRLIVEGVPSHSVSPIEIAHYLADLSQVLEMHPLILPVTHSSPKFGWAGWIHWETSGAHFYAWDVPRLFFSVDIYACKPFDENKAVEFTQATFSARPIAHRAI